MPQIDRAQIMAQRLYEALDHLAELMPRLSALIAQPDTGGPRTGTIGHGAPESREPWNAAAGDVLVDIWYGLPALMNQMRERLGMTRLARPAARSAVAGIRALIPSVPLEALEDATRRCERWVTRAQQLPAIDEAEPWTSLPVMPHLGHPPLCPYCGTTALRMRKRAGEVACFMPDCTDGDGRATRARMEPGRMTGESRLVFGDDTFMTFEGEQ